MTATNQTCSNCRFWTDKESTERYGQGVCRRYPPTPLTRVPAMFPTTNPAAWCGEWDGDGAVNQG